jgi:hypothetical protein
MRWAQGGGSCMRSCRPARHWRGDGTRIDFGNHPASATPAGRRRLAAHVDNASARNDDAQTAG